MTYDFVAPLSILRKKTDRETDEAVAQFNYLRLFKLRHQVLRIFFFDLILTCGYGNTVRVLEFLTRRIKLKTNYTIQLFKHEMVLDKLNALDEYKALLYCTWACINIINDNTNFKEVFNNAFKQLRTQKYWEIQNRKKVITFL
ncbi:MAG: hypothetical protein RMJ67_07570 [Elusimicrobiota bacterium]|nr:hypothetical protein [Endomicrobiia bacterium]MDW7973272.1 hypothetical protein [Thermodesulfovibrio sp.]MDW8166350.1 hypothetical protein [Elusimicrobiota bacterium]